MRGEKDDLNNLLRINDPQDEEEEEDDEEAVTTTSQGGPSSAVFTLMIDDEDSESEEDSENKDRETTTAPSSLANIASENGLPIMETAGEEEESEEDIDALLAEFQEKDEQDVLVKPSSENTNPFASILSQLDLRDLDYDYSSRNALIVETGVPDSSSYRKSRQPLLFGPAREGWTRPPSYVGGGIGMVRLSDLDPDSPAAKLPWPYNEISTIQDTDDIWSGTADLSNWFLFLHSPDFASQVEDFRKVQQMGDFNTLMLFVVHHPFVTEALFQASTVLYQSNHGAEALSLLRRCIWIFECASLSGFSKALDSLHLMNYDTSENKVYFDSLLRLMKVSYIAGLSRSALAISRFILALDPLRDPVNVLLCLDYFALANGTSLSDQWLVDFAESESTHIFHRENVQSEISKTSILSLPNWKYSYALALFRLSQEGRVERRNADDALLDAINMFPSIVPLILQANAIDVSGRSFRNDWASIIDFFPRRSAAQRNEWLSSGSTVLSSAIIQVVDSIIDLFVQMNALIWSGEDTLGWMYDVAVRAKQQNASIGSLWPEALLRYGDFDKSSFEKSFPFLPPDANVVDPALLAQAMVVDTNRPRLLRRMHNRDIDVQLLGGIQGAPMLFGPPTGLLDPDWPIAELFWRSFLPWNRVMGVPPPRR